MGKPIFQGLKERRVIMAILLAAAVFLTYYSRAVLEWEAALNHLLYIPIILASFWWKRKGLFVAIFFGAVLLTGYVFLEMDAEPITHSLFEVAMFIVAALVVAMLSEQMEKHNKEARKERRFSQNVIATVPESLLVLDKDLRIKSANRSFYQLFQTEPEKTMGRKLSDILGDGDGTLSAELNKLFGTEDILENFEFHYQSPKPGERIFNITARGIIVAEEEEEEEEEEELVAIRDITKRKRAEQMLQKSEENFRRSLDDSPLGIRIVNSDGETAYANRAILDIYGYASIKELKATPVKERYTPESYAQHQMRKEKRLRGEYVPSNYEISIVRKDGEIRHLEVFRKEVLWNGHPQFQVLYSDVTERKRAEEALEESEARYRSLVHLGAEVGEAIVMLQDEGEREGVHSFFNETWPRLTGYSEKELLNMSFFDLMHPKDRKNSLTRHRGKMAGKSIPGLFELTIVRKDGSEIPVEVTSAYTKYQGKPANVVYIRDITERKQAEEALRKSEERLKATVMNAPIGIATSGVDRYFLSANDAFCRIVGYTEAELQKMSFKDITHPEDIKESVARLDDIDVGKMTSFSQEKRYIKKDGKVIIGKVMVSAVRGHDGRPYLYIAELEDITEHKLAEETLKKSEERLKEAQVLGRIGSWEFDVEKQTITWSEETYVLYERDLKLGPPSPGEEARYYSSEQARVLRDYAARAIETGQTLSYDLEVTLPSGKTAHYHTVMRPVEDSQGRVVKLSGTVQDITERKRAEEALRESEQKYSMLVEKGNDGIVLIQDGLLRFANSRILEMTGFTLDEALGKPFVGFVAPEYRNLLLERHQKRMAGEIVLSSYEAAIVAKDGKTIPVEVNANMIEYAGEPADMAIVRDITERKRAEAEKRELERKAQNASRLASIGEMAAGIAHEINNPLTPVLGFTEMLMKRELPEDVKSDLKIIYDSTRRTADVTRRLLTFARQSKPMRTLCNINEVIESTLQLRAYQLKTNSIKVVTDLVSELPPTMADAGQLQQVLLNLIMNAEYEMTHSHGGGNLLIKTEKIGNIIRVSVKDDGPGISRENIERLFTPFFTTKKVGEGTGLGLSVCHGIVAEHNGRIYAESKVGKGATFIVELPIVGQQKEEKTKPSESDTGEAGEAVKSRILVVDDELTIVQVLKRVLTDEGYEVKATGKAKEALRLIESGKYACILLDIKLPDMSGIELYQHLDKTDKPSTQRIIFITGDVMGADTMDFFSRTGAAYITKPFDIEQLKKELKSKLLRRE